MNKKQIQKMEQHLEINKIFQQFQKLANDPNQQWYPAEHAYLLRWYALPGNNEEIDKMLFKKLAKQYQIIFEVAWLKLPNAELRMISISGVQQSNLLDQFLNHIIRMFTPLPISTVPKYKIIKAFNFNRYGSYQIHHSFQCIICLDKNIVTTQSCCGKSICQKCDSPEKCHYCQQKPIRRRFILKQQIQNFNRFTQMLWQTLFASN